VTVQISDKGGSSCTATNTATVADAALSAISQPFLPTEGASYSGVVGAFTDADGGAAAGDYTATITWGDGATSSGMVAANGSGGFSISGTHTYAEEGSQTVKVQVSDAGGSSVTVTSTATVQDALLSLSAITFTTSLGQTFSGNLATFIDAGGDAAT